MRVKECVLLKVEMDLGELGMQAYELRLDPQFSCKCQTWQPMPITPDLGTEKREIDRGRVGGASWQACLPEMVSHKFNKRPCLNK